MGPRTGLDDVARKKFLPLPGLELWPLGHPAPIKYLHRLPYPGSPTKTLISWFVGPTYCLVYFFESNFAFHAAVMSLSITKCTCSEAALKMGSGGGGGACVNYWFPMRIMQSPEGASVIKAACLHKNRENFRRARLQTSQRFVLRGPGATAFQLSLLRILVLFFSLAR
jgi:hypothetical protein